MLERLPATPPGLMRGLAMAAVVGQAGIAVTGAVVRVTGSGLGCPTWPQCFPGSLVPVPHAEIAVLHQWVEFGNRLLGIALVIVTGGLPARGPGRAPAPAAGSCCWPPPCRSAWSPRP